MAVKSILGLALLAQGITTGCAWEFKWSGTDNCAGAVNPISGVGSAGCTHIGSAGVFDFVLTDGCTLNLFPSGITGTSECTGGFIPATKPGCAAGAVTDYYFTVTCP